MLSVVTVMVLYVSSWASIPVTQTSDWQQPTSCPSQLGVLQFLCSVSRTQDTQQQCESLRCLLFGEQVRATPLPWLLKGQLQKQHLSNYLPGAVCLVALQAKCLGILVPEPFWALCRSPGDADRFLEQGHCVRGRW